MRKSRFPKAAYVRRLEQLYADLSEWREAYKAASIYTDDPRHEHRLLTREWQLKHVQDDLLVAINQLYGLDDLS